MLTRFCGYQNGEFKISMHGGKLPFRVESLRKGQGFVRDGHLIEVASPGLGIWGVEEYNLTPEQIDLVERLGLEHHPSPGRY